MTIHRLLATALFLAACTGCAQHPTTPSAKADAGKVFSSVWISHPHHLVTRASPETGAAIAFIDNVYPNALAEELLKLARFESYPSGQRVPGNWRRWDSDIRFKPDAKLANGDYAIRLSGLPPQVVMRTLPYCVFRVGPGFRIFEIRLVAVDTKARTFSGVRLGFTEPPDESSLALEVQRRAPAKGATWQAMSATFTKVPQPSKTPDHFSLASPVGLDDTVRITLTAGKSKAGASLDTVVRVGLTSAAPGTVAFEFVPATNANGGDMFLYYPPVVGL